MEKLIVENEEVAAEIGRKLSDNLYYEDKFSPSAFMAFCNSLPAIVGVTYTSNYVGVAYRAVSIRFIDHTPINIVLSSSWFIQFFLFQIKHFYPSDRTTITVYKPSNS